LPDFSISRNVLPCGNPTGFLGSALCLANEFAKQQLFVTLLKEIRFLAIRIKLFVGFYQAAVTDGVPAEKAIRIFVRLATQTHNGVVRSLPNHFAAVMVADRVEMPDRV
jgi:hypothetical protein